MDTILQGIPEVQCTIDDMIITGETDDAHLRKLEEVLKRLEEYGLRARLDKCQFFLMEIEFCRHVIDSEGLHKTQNKIEAIVNAPEPTNVSQLRSFLGIINNYNNYFAPTHRLLQKEVKVRNVAEPCRR